MRILHTSSSADWGGAQIRTLTEAAGLVARGHEVTIACPAGSPLAARAASHRVPVVELPASLGLGRDSLAGRARALAALRRLIAEGEFDVIATHGPVDSWLVALARASLARAPATVRIHHPSASAPRGPANRWLYMRAASRVVTGGEAIRQSLVRDQGFDGRRIVSVPTGVDLQHFRPGDRAEARHALELPDDGWPVLGIVASLRRAKGHHLLIEALAGLREPARLLVVGDGPQRAALEKQADAMLPPDRVRFAGRQADVLPWLQALDVFVLPTLHEGIPQSLSQAMGVGLCCVTTPVGGIPEIAVDGESALFVAPGKVDELRAGIERVLGDAGLRERLGGAAREAALQRCSIEAMLDRMERLFADVASRIAP
ncbi:glycosyltransferase family 4 protein [Burkholderiaceae bacterium FT117]|uniref:glycosyltransferase family 4 protein n=1 Tax=Zeimonas sediminis TaxID=2944268 RepID=UPI00234319A2|nr:glycosyltransferase family 4 protein [Zeimonas sediminis]MCM5570376.1 glycosyltransferase family 4 protein [Zeimonas sediminis]